MRVKDEDRIEDNMDKNEERLAEKDEKVKYNEVGDLPQT